MVWQIFRHEWFASMRFGTVRALDILLIVLGTLLALLLIHPE